MSGIYLHDWAQSELYRTDYTPRESVFADFSCFYHDDGTDKKAKFDHVEILVASYTYEDYSGNAFVLFRDTRDGLLYEVNGGHCSCFGLEGQWEPEATSVDALRHRVKDGWFDDGVKEAIQTVLDAMGTNEAQTGKE